MIFVLCLFPFVEELCSTENVDRIFAYSFTLFFMNTQVQICLETAPSERSIDVVPDLPSFYIFFKKKKKTAGFASPLRAPPQLVFFCFKSFVMRFFLKKKNENRQLIVAAKLFVATRTPHDDLSFGFLGVLSFCVCFLCVFPIFFNHLLKKNEKRNGEKNNNNTLHITAVTRLFLSAPKRKPVLLSYVAVRLHFEKNVRMIH